jgi:[ribosomal protein S5]-alanine N-acetyltransferase
MIVTETKRLQIRQATAADADFYYQLWTNPRVMAQVGFPQGLRISREEVEALLDKAKKGAFDGRPYDGRLLVVRKEDDKPIGEAALHPPELDGIASTDVKLLPAHWGQGYGAEIKQALVDYLFTHTDCQVVEATPNQSNIASIKMQEAVGGVCVGDTVYEFPEHMQAYTNPVHALIYHVRREDWERNKK